MSALRHSVIRLKPGRERSLRQRHPWVFSGAIDSITGNPSTGATVDVVGADGSFLARAAYSPVLIELLEGPASSAGFESATYGVLVGTYGFAYFERSGSTGVAGGA